MRRRLTLAALAALALTTTAGCRLLPESPGFLPDGSGLWFADLPRDDNGDGVDDRTARIWLYWCFGTPERPLPCGTERAWSWGELGTVAP